MWGDAVPRFLSAKDIPMAKRKPHLNRYRRQLREALLNPGLTKEKRAEIKEQLRTLGQPKIYGAAKAATPQHPPTPPPDPEPDPEPAPKVLETLEDLMGEGHADLLGIAEGEGVEAYKSWTKERIAQAILDHRAEAAE